MSVAAEMINRFSKISSLESIFTLGSCHVVDPSTTLKTRFSNNGKVAMLCQHEWRPKSLVTLSAEYDVKATNASPKLGLALALNFKLPCLLNLGSRSNSYILNILLAPDQLVCW